jgi:hypothetical protein
MNRTSLCPITITPFYPKRSALSNVEVGWPLTAISPAHTHFASTIHHWSLFSRWEFESWNKWMNFITQFCQDTIGTNGLDWKITALKHIAHNLASTYTHTGTEYCWSHFSFIFHYKVSKCYIPAYRFDVHISEAEPCYLSVKWLDYHGLIDVIYSYCFKTALLRCPPTSQRKGISSNYLTV